MIGMLISDAEFALFRGMLRDIAGVRLAEGKKAMVTSRLVRRLHASGLDSFGDYFRLIARDPGELQRALDLLTTHETYFFREPKHFEFLARRILPEARPQAALRVWSAASSTGEEAYSIAMVLMEHLGAAAPWEVFGSDISAEVLGRARRGVYAMDRIDGLPPAYLRRYCRRGVGRRSGTLLVEGSLRQRVRFARVNLNGPLEDVGRFDVVFLRNVLIYFDPPTKREVLARVLRQINPGGWLLVGHSESLHGMAEGLRMEQPAIYRKA